MKRTFLVLAAIAMVSFTSCNKAKEEVKEENTEVSTEAESTEATEESTDVAEVPEFESEKLAEYITAYDAYMEDYKQAVESKDMTKFQELGAKGQELATKGQELAGENLSESDAQKLTDYMQEKSAELQELTQKMMN